MTRARDDIDRATVAFEVPNASFVEAWGKNYTGSRCINKRALDEEDLIAVAKIAGGAAAAPFMGDACPSLNYLG
nr:sulfur reduction protein DsrE [Paraburkholderia atlantica]